MRRLSARRNAELITVLMTSASNSVATRTCICFCFLTAPSKIRSARCSPKGIESLPPMHLRHSPQSGLQFSKYSLGDSTCEELLLDLVSCSRCQRDGAAKESFSCTASHNNSAGPSYRGEVRQATPRSSHHHSRKPHRKCLRRGEC